MPTSLERLPSYWNEPAYVELVCQSLRALKLPEMTLDLEEGSWNELEDQVLEYFGLIQKSYGENAEHLSRLERCLKKARRVLNTKSLESTYF